MEDFSLISDAAAIPAELDDHLRIFGKTAYEFKYFSETCPTCDNRIDELGWCGHGNVGGG